MNIEKEQGGMYLKVPMGLVSVIVVIVLNAGIWIWGISQISATTENIAVRLNEVTNTVEKLEERTRKVELEQASQKVILATPPTVRLK